MTSRTVTLLLFILGAALVVALGVLVLRGGEDDLSLNPGEPETASFDQLVEVGSESETQPLYWVGERDGVEYEVTKTRAGRYYVRYLKGGAEAGDERPDFVAVGTYPSKDGVGDLREAKEATDGAELGRTDDGAILLIDPTSVKSVHLAYPGGDSQVEIYSPVPGQALRIAERGGIQPIQ